MIEKVKALIKERESIHPEDYITIEKFWEKASTEFAKDIKALIEFMLNECTADEFSWILEFSEEIVEKTQSKEFIDCLYKVAEKYPEETKKYNIIENIEFVKQKLLS